MTSPSTRPALRPRRPRHRAAAPTEVGCGSSFLPDPRSPFRSGLSAFPLVDRWESSMPCVQHRARGSSKKVRHSSGPTVCSTGLRVTSTDSGGSPHAGSTLCGQEVDNIQSPRRVQPAVLQGPLDGPRMADRTRGVAVQAQRVDGSPRAPGRCATIAGVSSSTAPGSDRSAPAARARRSRGRGSPRATPPDRRRRPGSAATPAMPSTASSPEPASTARACSSSSSTRW